MGHGAFDDTRQVLKLEQPSIQTTNNLINEMASHDLLLHVGDLSYADGYEPIVSGLFTCADPMLAHKLPIFISGTNIFTK